MIHTNKDSVKIFSFILMHITRSIIHPLPLTQYCAGGKIEKNEMGGACGAYGGGERRAQSSGGET